MSATNLAIIFATLAGPILAVQAQKWLERGRSIKERRLSIFRTLMSTRAATLSPVHVEALNAVPVEFYGSRGQLKDINDAWKLFLDHHSPELIATEVWVQKRLDLFIDLLFLISQYLGYGFSKAQLARDIYSPRAHGDLETEQTLIRRGLARLLNGEAALPMAVTEFPATADDDTLAMQAAINKALLSWLNGQSSVKINDQPEH